jgi:uncharacterized protein
MTMTTTKSVTSMKKSLSLTRHTTSTDCTEESLPAQRSSPFDIRFGENTHAPRKNNQHPLSLTIRHKIVPGKENAYAKWAQETGKLLTHFQGFMDAEVIRPLCCESNEYVSILHFDTYDNMQVWMKSAERRAQLEKAADFEAEPIQISYHSLEFWFVSEDKNSVVVPPPSREKMAVVIFLVIWFQSQYISPHTIYKWKALSLVGKRALSTLMIVTLSTYVIMPIVTKYILHWWLFPNPSTQARWIQLLNCSWRPTTTNDHPAGMAKKEGGDAREPPQDDSV